MLYLRFGIKRLLPVQLAILSPSPSLCNRAIFLRADVKVDTAQTCVAIRGPQTEAQLRALYSRASIYAATARYEPLGMAALEAAFSRCAIVANDIPSFREVWGDAALYFRTNDAASLADKICQLNADRAIHHQAHDRRLPAALPQPGVSQISGCVKCIFLSRTVQLLLCSGHSHR